MTSRPPRALAHLGPLLTALRRRRGWSRSQLASSSGLSPATVARYEKSGRTPSMPTLEAVLEALDCDLREVLLEPFADEAGSAEDDGPAGEERAHLRSQMSDLHRRLDRIEVQLLGRIAGRASELVRGWAARPVDLDMGRWSAERQALADHLGELRRSLALEPPPTYSVEIGDLADIDFRAKRPAKTIANDLE